MKGDVKIEKYTNVCSELGKLAKLEGIAEIEAKNAAGKTIFAINNHRNASFRSGRKFKYVGKTAGRLMMRVNDWSPGDNTGALNVAVKGKTFEISADKDWLPVGVTIAPGEIFAIKASGTWQEGTTGRAYNADGLNIISWDNLHAFSE